VSLEVPIGKVLVKVGSRSVETWVGLDREVVVDIAR
jgi:hypothetical protein